MVNHPDKPVEQFVYHGREVLINKRGSGYSFAIAVRGGYEVMEGWPTHERAKKGARVYYWLSADHERRHASTTH